MIHLFCSSYAQIWVVLLWFYLFTQLSGSELSTTDAQTLVAAFALFEKKHFNRVGGGVELEFLPWWVVPEKLQGRGPTCWVLFYPGFGAKEKDGAWPWRRHFKSTSRIPVCGSNDREFSFEMSALKREDKDFNSCFGVWTKKSARGFWISTDKLKNKQRDRHVKLCCRLRHFGHSVWKEIQQNVDTMWNVYYKLIEARKVRQQRCVNWFCHQSCCLNCTNNQMGCVSKELVFSACQNNWISHTVGAPTNKQSGSRSDSKFKIRRRFLFCTLAQRSHNDQNCCSFPNPTTTMHICVHFVARRPKWIKRIPSAFWMLWSRSRERRSRFMGNPNTSLMNCWGLCLLTLGQEVRTGTRSLTHQPDCEGRTNIESNGEKLSSFCCLKRLFLFFFWVQG